MHTRSKSKIARTDAKASNDTPFLVRWLIAISSLMLMALLFTGIKQAQASDPIRILAFGDSLSAGYQLPPGAGFTDRLQAQLRQSGLDVVIVNAAVSGDTTANGLARLDWSTPDDIDFVLLELGANDALQGLSVEKARANLAAMIEKFQAKDAEVILMGMRAPPNMGQDYVTAFDAIYPALAEQYGTPLYPFFLDGVAAEPGLNLADGIHPNAKGIEIITKRIAPFVTELVKAKN